MKRSTINQQVASRMASLEQKYHASLERCLQKGEDALICRDVELCEHVEVVLRTGNTQVLLGPMTLDSQTLDMLSVMETSLQNPGASLEGVERTFEVLELAALNLYLCPWRKEYRVVKMFSGTFTHQVSPVLSKQQTKELFGLLGYQAVAGHSQCEELELKGSPLPAKFLLRFACLFFIARCECRLLYSVAKVLGGRQTLELALVQERQRGCSLERAQQSLQSKMEMSQQGENAEDELDLYTAEASNAKLTMTGRKVSTLPKERASGEEELEEKARGGPVEWHTCIVKEALSLFFCHTCNLVHDVLCVEACLQQHHELLEFNKGQTESGIRVMSYRVETLKAPLLYIFGRVKAKPWLELSSDLEDDEIGLFHFALLCRNVLTQAALLPCDHGLFIVPEHINSHISGCCIEGVRALVGVDNECTPLGGYEHKHTCTLSSQTL
ncbi:hypothetical protein Z043_123864 [Scleropages formosus]|uniref:Spermatogenesis-associated protein 2 PUB-like domain-containing protein n=1 Tax=Scleropages formosus TaxID=113540 RepID=A0A0N8JVJ6_SCLFO|nr:hypothetical protein Z043_123864 [Scleropages formosus]